MNHPFYGNTNYRSSGQNYGNMPDFSQFDWDGYNQKMALQQEKTQLKKISNRIGLALVLFQVIISVLSVVLIIPLFFTGGIDLSKYSYENPLESSLSIIDPVTLYLLNGVLCLLGFLIVGIIIVKTNHVRLDETIFIRKTDFADTVKIVVAGMGMVLIFNILLVLMNMNLSLFGFKNEMPDYGKVEGLAGSILYFISVAIVPPIIEEFVFRGTILGTIRKYYGDTLAIIVSSVLFGFAHANFLQTPVTFLTGLVLGWIVVKTGSIIPAMILHFLNNAIAVISQLMVFNIESDTLFTIIDFSISGLFVIGGLICAMSLIKKYGNKLFVFEKKESKLTFSQQLKAVFTSAWMIIFTLITLASCFAAASVLG